MGNSFVNHRKYKSQPLPRHVAIIMDGNGRWAKNRGKPRIFGHKRGVESVRAVVRTAASLGIEALTLYAFSEENWGRPQTEVQFLLSLLDYYLEKDREELRQNNVQLRIMGRLEALPIKTQTLIQKTQKVLSANTGLVLNIALSYSGQQEILHACKLMVQDAKDAKLDINNINASLFESYLWTKGLPSPDLIIRTSGEQRLSNFLLWQCAYAELWFTPVYWPDFRQDDFLDCILAFQKRDRRFGKVCETEQKLSSVICVNAFDHKAQEIC